MIDIMASVFVDDHPLQAKLTSFLDGNCILTASTVSTYSLREMLLSVLAAGSTNSSRNALFDRSSSKFDIAFHGIWTETNPNMR